MQIGALGLFRRTSERGRYIVASWHSPHSLTWSWCLTVSGQPLRWPKPFAMANTAGFGAGLGQMLAFDTYTTNGGRQWFASLFWVSFSWRRQRPLYYREMFARERGEHEALQRRHRRLQDEIAGAQHRMAREEYSDELQRLN